MLFCVAWLSLLMSELVSRSQKWDIEDTKDEDAGMNAATQQGGIFLYLQTSTFAYCV